MNGYGMACMFIVNCFNNFAVARVKIILIIIPTTEETMFIVEHYF